MGVAEVLRDARGCTRCPALVAARTQVVPGEGDDRARVLLLTGPPTREEDAAGRPLPGRSGALLDELLLDVGLHRGAVLVTSALRCRPPGNRDPQPAELQACSAWTTRLAAELRPRVVVALGVAAARTLRASVVADGVVELGGHAAHLLEVPHPDAAGYAEPVRWALRDGLARVPGLLAFPAVVPAPPEPPPGEAEPGPAQLGLF